MRRYTLIAPVLAMLSLLPLQSASAATSTPKGWEAVRYERTDAKQVVKEADIEIKSATGTIIVSTNHTIQIKVFTILGRLVNNETLPVGTSQFQLPAHGVYIVKIGDLTCKVAV